MLQGALRPDIPNSSGVVGPMPIATVVPEGRLRHSPRSKLRSASDGGGKVAKGSDRWASIVMPRKRLHVGPRKVAKTFQVPRWVRFRSVAQSACLHTVRRSATAFNPWTCLHDCRRLANGFPPRAWRQLRLSDRRGSAGVIPRRR